MLPPNQITMIDFVPVKNYHAAISCKKEGIQLSRKHLNGSNFQEKRIWSIEKDQFLAKNSDFTKRG